MLKVMLSERVDGNGILTVHTLVLMPEPGNILDLKIANLIFVIVLYLFSILKHISFNKEQYPP